MRHLKILSTSDVHGFLYPTNYSQRDDHRPYGWLRAATLIRQIQAQAGPDDIVLTIENGDWIEGSSFDSYLATAMPEQAEILSKIPQALNYDLGVLGNHEFNYGLDYLRNCLAERNYPVLGANIDGGHAQGIIDAPYQIFKKKGVKIAVLGLTTAYVPVWEPASHLTGLTFQSALATAQHWVPKLKQRADLVVVAYHGGFEADLTTGQPTEQITGENEGYQLLTQVPGIDALITGHQHRLIAGVYHEIPVTQPGDKAVAVGEIELDLDGDNQVVGHRATLLSTAKVVPDATLSAQLQPLQDQTQDWLDTPVGHIGGASLQVTDHLAARLHSHPYLNFINQVEAAAGQVDIAATAHFNDDVQGFGTTVTRRQVLNSYPYPNTLVVERVTGADLKAALERCASFFTLQDGQITVSDTFTTPKLALYNYDIYAGIDYTFDLTQPVGQRLRALSYHGQPVADDQELDIVMNQYRGNGGGEYPMFRASKIIREINVSVAQLIQDYLTAHPNVTGEQPHNLTILH
ncbi:bifunctional metallophosphatase/5'-nucleotidase [Levilactobacillus namurensis]|uniref:bifunctional metallophosphatase/5'-nucleotidase n=1 Tax=Levilactobacillus namurensis TaxID=380393 RepID=UPI00046460AB|nr:bifunctional UDP-sugar hydrolase/5'-nucleotidase [Levilactobacillus namurensis]